VAVLPAALMTPVARRRLGRTLMEHDLVDELQLAGAAR
jgi:hypothetical protein